MDELDHTAFKKATLEIQCDGYLPVKGADMERPGLMNVRKELQADRMKKKDSTLKKLEAHFRIIHPNATREDQKNRWLTASTNPSLKLQR